MSLQVKIPVPVIQILTPQLRTTMMEKMSEALEGLENQKTELTSTRSKLILSAPRTQEEQSRNLQQCQQISRALDELDVRIEAVKGDVERIPQQPEGTEISSGQLECFATLEPGVDLGALVRNTVVVVKDDIVQEIRTSRTEIV